MMEIVLILAAVVLIAAIVAYNRLVAKRNAVTNAFGSIDAMLKKRYDLIPNLAATVQRYAQHEQETLAKVTGLRTGDFDGLSEQAKREFDARFGAAYKSLMLVAENYPDLKASENFVHLQRTLNETEEQLSAARRTYNACVTDYNNSVQMFPSSVVASLFSFREKEILAIPEEERGNPDVKQLFRS